MRDSIKQSSGILNQPDGPVETRAGRAASVKPSLPRQVIDGKARAGIATPLRLGQKHEDRESEMNQRAGRRMSNTMWLGVIALVAMLGLPGAGAHAQ
jgi:hypothetical protein